MTSNLRNVTLFGFEASDKGVFFWVSYTYLAAPVRARNSIPRLPFDLLRTRSSCPEKKENQGALKVSVLAARLNFNTPYRVIRDLSAPRRRVNQTENDRRLSSSHKFRRFDLSTVDHAYPDASKLLRVCFTGISCHEKPSFDNPSLSPSHLLDLSRLVVAREPRKHVNSIKTLRLFLSRPLRASPYLPFRLFGHNGEISFFW